MPPKSIGGRGKPAGYKSTHVRLPEEVKFYIELVKEHYFNDTLPDYETFKDLLSNNPLPPFDEALAEANKLLRSKKSARYVADRLLKFIYGKDMLQK